MCNVSWHFCCSSDGTMLRKRKIKLYFCSKMFFYLSQVFLFWFLLQNRRKVFPNNTSCSNTFVIKCCSSLSWDFYHITRFVKMSWLFWGEKSMNCTAPNADWTVISNCTELTLIPAQLFSFGFSCAEKLYNFSAHEKPDWK